MTQARPKVAMFTRDALDPRIVSAFSELLAVDFVSNPDPQIVGSVNAVVLAGVDEAVLERAPQLPRYVFIAGTREAGGETSQTSDVRFTEDRVLDARLRGRVLRHAAVRRPAMLRVDRGDDVLASFGRAACWTVRTSAATQVHRVAFPLPCLQADELPFHHLNGDRFIQLLPFVHFLREVVGEFAWQPPAPRACFMLDDPNLHWPTYGFVDYREIAALAERDNFHLAVAMVPLDGWYVSSAASALFREHSNRLSLLMHGNDHLRQELGLPRTEEESTRMLAQALSRIATLERRSGVRISRAMAPPHGACRPELFRLMFRMGYEGACISPWSLQDWAGGRVWPDTFGLASVERADEGFPVAPRFGLSEQCEGWAVINAFLDRPIIAVGHHSSLRQGTGVLSGLAASINRIPGIQWTNVEQILQSRYATRRQDATLYIRPLAARLTVPIPPDVTRIVVESEHGWKADEGGSRLDDSRNEFAVAPRSMMRMRQQNWGSFECRHPYSRPAIWAPVRRVLCEARDRMQPMMTGRTQAACH